MVLYIVLTLGESFKLNIYKPVFYFQPYSNLNI